MNGETFFPFTRYGGDRSGGVGGGLYKDWMAVRPEDVSWYCVDVVVLSPTEVRFLAHSMAHLVYGGKGPVVWTHVAKIAPDRMLPLLEDRADWLARVKRVEELRAEEERIVSEYADAILTKALRE